MKLFYEISFAFLIQLMTLIPLVEVTRQILLTIDRVQVDYWYWGEIGFYWLCWLLIIPLVIDVFNRIEKKIRNRR